MFAHFLCFQNEKNMYDFDKNNTIHLTIQNLCSIIIKETNVLKHQEGDDNVKKNYTI